jgi:hypothetical protein
LISTVLGPDAAGAEPDAAEVAGVLPPLSPPQPATTTAHGSSTHEPRTIQPMTNLGSNA